MASELLASGTAEGALEDGDERSDATTRRRRGRPPSNRNVRVVDVKPKLFPEAELREKVDALKLVGLTDAELADATGTSESAVAKWRAATVPAPSARTKLDQIRAVALHLISQGVDPEGVHGWLTGIDPKLKWRSPLALIREGEFDLLLTRLEEIAPWEPLQPAGRNTKPKRAAA